MLQIQNLHVEIEGNEILKGLNLEVKPGEIHAIMGPNGTGKSTLANVIAGRDEYEVNDGSINFQGNDLLEMDPDERAREGIFLAFQYPVEIPGVSTTNFIKEAVKVKRAHLGLPPLSPKEFLSMMKEKMALVNIDQKFMSRALE